MVKNLRPLSSRNLLPIFLFLLVFISLSYFTLTTNIHGDGFTHALVAKKIVEKGELLEALPYWIMEIKDDHRIYYPISYPETFHVIVAIFFLIGDEFAIKLFSPFFGALASLFIYLLFRRVNKYFALLAPIFIIVLNIARYIMVPLMEPVLLAFAFISVYYYHCFLKKQTYDTRYIILTALFLGISISIKQTGIIIILSIFSHFFMTSMHYWIKNRDLKLIKQFLLLITVVLSISFLPLYEQIDRNGTIDMVPTYHDRVPIFTSKYITDPEAASERIKITPLFPNRNMKQLSEDFLIMPFFHTMRNVNIELYGFFIFIILLFGSLYLSNKDKLINSILIIFLFFNIIFADISNLPVQNYLIFGLSVCILFYTFAFLGLKNCLRLNRYVIFLFIFIMIFIIAINFPIYFNEVYGSGRYETYYLDAYKQMGSFVKNNTLEDSIFLAPAFGLSYYGDRDVIWNSMGGAAKTRLIFRTTNESEALYWLKYYNISYVFVDNRQTGYNGLGDWIPKNGLLDYIDNSKNFEKIFSTYPDDEVLTLYKVIY